MAHLQRVLAQAHRIAIVQPAGGLERLGRWETVIRCGLRQAIDPELIAFVRADDGQLQTLGEFSRGTGMVDVSVGDPDLLELQLKVTHRLQDDIEIPAWVDHGSLQRRVTPDERAVLLEGGNGDSLVVEHGDQNGRGLSNLWDFQQRNGRLNLNFRVRKSVVNLSAKSTLIVALAFCASFPVVAQTSTWEGWGAHVGLGYQSLKPTLDNVISAGDAKVVSATTAGSLVGKVGLDYTWALNAKYVLAAGLDYGLNYGKNSELSVQDTVQDRLKVKQGIGFNLAPGMLLDNRTLAYLKLGYQVNTAKFEADSITQSINAYTFGLGAKFLQGTSTFVFTELNYLAGQKKSFTSLSDTTGDIKAAGFVWAVGVGQKF